MPLTTTANYDTYAASLAKKPVWIVEISTISDKYTSGTFSGITASYKKVLKDISIDLFDVNLRNNVQNPTSGSFTIVDDDLIATLLVKNNDLHSLTVTIKHGFEDLIISDFLSVYPQLFVDDIIFDMENAEATFLVSDPMFNFKNDLFTYVPQTALDGDISDVATAITVFSTTAFLATTFAGFGAGEATNTYIIIDDEVMLYTAKTATEFTVTRARCMTKAEAHSSGTVVRQCYVWGQGGESQISEVMLNLLMTTSAGTNGERDAGISGFGMGIEKAKINTNEIRIKAGEQWAQFCVREVEYADNGTPVADDMGYFYYYEKKAASQVLNDLAAMVSCAWAIGTDGKLTLRRADYFGLRTATNNLAAKSTWGDKLKLNDRAIYNTVKITIANTAYILSLKYISQEATVTYKPSITQYGQRLIKEINWQCNHIPTYNIFGYVRLKSIVAEYLLLFSDITSDFSFNSLFTNTKYVPGDMVGYNETNAPDIGAGTRGLTNEPVLITSKSMGLSECSFNATAFTLLTRLSVYSALPAYQTPNREAATYSTNDTFTLEANDAYIDNPTGAFNLWKVKIELVSPASGAAKKSWIDLSFRFLVNSTTEATAWNWRYSQIRFFYDPSVTYTWTYELVFFLNMDDPPNSLQRIKMDWIAASETSGSGLRPSSVKMKGVTGIDINALNGDFTNSTDFEPVLNNVGIS